MTIIHITIHTSGIILQKNSDCKQEQDQYDWAWSTIIIKATIKAATEAKDKLQAFNSDRAGPDQDPQSCSTYSKQVLWTAHLLCTQAFLLWKRHLIFHAKSGYDLVFAPQVNLNTLISCPFKKKKKIWNRVDCQRSGKRYKTHKRFKKKKKPLFNWTKQSVSESVSCPFPFTSLPHPTDTG